MHVYTRVIYLSELLRIPGDGHESDYPDASFALVHLLALRGVKRLL